MSPCLFIVNINIAIREVNTSVHIGHAHIHLQIVRYLEAEEAGQTSTRVWQGTY